MTAVRGGASMTAAGSSLPGASGPLTVRPGPLLLADLGAGPGLDAHRRRAGSCPEPGLDELLDAVTAVDVRGRGGAGFPFATKLRTAAARRRRVVVVNAAEGEPASHKDSALLTSAPHRVLDGARVVARALGCRSVDIIVPGERPQVGAAVAAAIAERRGERVTWRVQATEGRFVSGQARAVLELLAGRPNLPVTAWQPEAVSGHRGRPTLLSNAETFAHVGAIARLGVEGYLRAAGGTGTCLLSISTGAGVRVVEASLRTGWSRVLTADELSGPVLLGGYHGSWLAADTLTRTRLDYDELRSAGTPLGAGVVVTGTGCPVSATARIVNYLAGESAGRCGPCRNGLPALARAVTGLAAGAPAAGEQVRELTGLVDRRGACAHPDGTVRLVRSLLGSFADEVDAHRLGSCGWSSPVARRLAAAVQS